MVLHYEGLLRISSSTGKCRPRDLQSSVAGFNPEGGARHGFMALR